MFKIPEYCNLNLRMSRVVSSDRSMKEWHRGFWEFSGRCGELQIREQQKRMRSILWFLSAVVRSENRPHLSCIGAVGATTVQICFYGPSWRLEFTWTRNFSFFKMPAKMGINGFGRIGRLVFRAAMANPEVEVYLCDVLCAAAFSEIFVFGFGFCALGPGMFIIGDRGSILSKP